MEQLGPYKVVDLTRKLLPSVEKRRLIVRRFFKEESQDYHSDIDLTSHLGTHVESPYHYKDSWPDIASLPVIHFMGRGVRLHLTEIAPRAEITRADLDKADRGRVRREDIVILTSPFHCIPFSNDPEDQRPWLGEKAGLWFADKSVKGVGFGDSVAIEHSVSTACEFHESLMSRRVVFIEVMEHLEELSNDIFLLIFLPVPIVGLDSCPVRAVAIEGIPGFSDTS